MPEAVGALTLDVDLAERSLYRLLAENGVIATSGVRSAEATVATHEQAQHLGVSAGSALLRLRSVSRGEDGAPIEYFVAGPTAATAPASSSSCSRSSRRPRSCISMATAEPPAPAPSAEPPRVRRARPGTLESMTSWTSTAITLLEADANRSADTHLHLFPLPPEWGIDLYLKDESVHPTGSLKHRLARSLLLYGLVNSTHR